MKLPSAPPGFTGAQASPTQGGMTLPQRGISTKKLSEYGHPEHNAHSQSPAFPYCSSWAGTRPSIQARHSRRPLSRSCSSCPWKSPITPTQSHPGAPLSLLIPNFSPHPPTGAVLPALILDFKCYNQESPRCSGNEAESTGDWEGPPEEDTRAWLPWRPSTNTPGGERPGVGAGGSGDAGVVVRPSKKSWGLKAGERSDSGCESCPEWHWGPILQGLSSHA